MPEHFEAEAKSILILMILAILVPYVRESEISGSGIYVALDAVFGTTITLGLLWKVEYRWHAAFAPPIENPINVILPYLDISLTTLFVVICGFLSIIFLFIALSGRISINSGFWLILLATVIVFLPGVLVYEVGDFYTYQRMPLPIIQVLSLIILLVFNRKRMQSTILR